MNTQEEREKSSNKVNSIAIKYSTHSKEIPPQPIKLANMTWAGSFQKKMEDGSEVQPWHCLPFVEGSTYGLELIYPYETECHVVGTDGTIRFDWDFAKEPGGVLFGGEFRAFSPLNASQFYSVHTGIDIVPPPGYVLRSEPHPRYFTDNTDTVPLAMIGHLQQEWYPRRVSLVFRAPRQGSRHIFRKGEPYVQILFVPQQIKYEISRLTDEEEVPRRELASAMLLSQFEIAENTWHNPEGAAFGNHYKVMGRAFAQDGIPGVKDLVQKSVERIANSFPRDKPISECMALGVERMREAKFALAEMIFTHILERDPDNASAHNNLGVCLVKVGNWKDGIKAMMQATALQPGSADYHINLGVQLRHLGQVEGAEASFRKALALTPHDQELLNIFGLMMIQQGRADEALQVYQTALKTGTPNPHLYHGMGMILAHQGEGGQARACFEAALGIVQDFAPARQALQKLLANAPQ